MQALTFRWHRCGLWLALLGTLACGESPAPDGPATQQRALRSQLRARWVQGDSLPVSVATLRQRVPRRLPGFTADSLRIYHFAHPQRSYLAVQRLYHQGHGDTYLSLHLTDYSADTLAVLRLWEGWQPLDWPPQPAWPTPLPTFWRWQQQPVHGVTRFEAVLDARYLFTLQTNHPEGKALLSQIWTQVATSAQ